MPMRLPFESIIFCLPIIWLITLFDSPTNSILEKIISYILIGVGIIYFSSSAITEPLSKITLYIINTALSIGIILIIVTGYIYGINPNSNLETQALLWGIILAPCEALLLAILRNIRIRRTDEDLFGPIE